MTFLYCIAAFAAIFYIISKVRKNRALDFCQRNDMDHFTNLNN